MIKIRTISSQSIEDIALQHYGSVDGVVKLLADNRSSLSNGFDSTIAPGTELAIDPDYSTNAAVKLAIAQMQLTFTSAASAELVAANGPDFNDDFNNDFNSILE